jgi:hypothetical protein
MYCPECGYDAGEAKFCPECGTKLDHVREAVRGGGSAAAPQTARTTRKTTGGAASGAAARKTTGTAQRPPRDPDLGPSRSSSAPRPAPSGIRPLHLWIGVAVVAVVVAVTLVVLTNHKSSSAASGPVADTSGSYAALVARANDHYNQGQPYIEQGNFTAAAPYFLAAAKEYAGAWAQQATDPAVGTDYATSLFYAGDVQGAISQVNKALKLKPTSDILQKALLNKGNFLAMAGRVAQQSGQAAKTAKLLAQAKAMYLASIKVNPGSSAATSAQQGIASLTATPTPATSPSP